MHPATLHKMASAVPGAYGWHTLTFRYRMLYVGARGANQRTYLLSEVLLGDFHSRGLGTSTDTFLKIKPSEFRAARFAARSARESGIAELSGI